MTREFNPIASPRFEEQSTMRTVRAAAALSILLTGLAACGPVTSQPASGSPSVAPSPVTVKLGQVGGISDAAIFIGIEKGYFKEQGIDIDSQRFDSAARMVPFLGTGQLDVGAGSPSAGLYNAIARDVPVKIVADKGNMNPGHGYEAMVVRRQLWDTGSINGPADLRGKKVAIAARDISPEVTLDTFLKTGGLSVKDVEIVTMPFADMRQALANGSIDMAMPLEPFATQIAENGIGVIWKRDDEIVPRHQVAVILYSPDFAKKTDVARRFMLAYLKGARYYNDAFERKDSAKRKDAIAILAKSTPVKEEALYDKMVMPGIDPDGQVNLQSLSEEQDWFVKKGSQRTAVDLGKVVDNQFAAWAVQKLGPYR